MFPTREKRYGAHVLKVSVQTEFKSLQGIFLQLQNLMLFPGHRKQSEEGSGTLWSRGQCHKLYSC